MFGNTPPPTHVGPYVVLRELGRGGMGVVYVARDPGTGREVAVKQILAEGASGPAMARFLREAESLARVKHQGVVGVHQLGRTNEGPYIVLDLIEGEPLSARTARGPLEPALAARLVRDVADAIAAVHAQGIIHRDLKPANIMLRRDGSPVLLDFGLARDVNAEQLTRSGDVLGTVSYMAPEQADGRTRDLDERVDVYGLGAVLFELLAGVPPHQGAGFDVIVKILTKDPPRVRDRRPDVPPALDAVCALAMAREREQRYQSMRALRDDLGRFLGGQATAAEQRLAAAAPRGRRVVVALAAGALALGVALGVILAASGSEAEPAPLVDAPPGVAALTTRADAGRATGRLWAVRADEVLVYDLALRDVVGGQELDFRATLRLTPTGSTDPAVGPLALACELTAVRCSTGPMGVPYDSTAPQEDHPLAALGAAAGSVFHCRLDAESGAVSEFDGFEEILATVQAAPVPNRLPGLRQLAARVFTDSFMMGAMDALTDMRGTPRAPWGPGRKDGDGWSFTAESTRPEAPILESVLESLDAGVRPAEALYTLKGRATYDGHSIVRAELDQLLVDSGAERRMTWSMARVP